MELNFQKNNVVSGITPLFVLLLILFVLKFSFVRADLYGNVTFLIAAHCTKKRYSSLIKKVFGLEKTGFKVKALKTFKISVIAR